MEPIQHITLFFFFFLTTIHFPHVRVSLALCISSHPISSRCWIACSRTSNFNLNRRWSISLANCLWQHQQFESKGFIGNLKGILTHPHHVVGTYCLLCQEQLSWLNTRKKSFSSTAELGNGTEHPFWMILKVGFETTKDRASQEGGEKKPNLQGLLKNPDKSELRINISTKET